MIAMQYSFVLPADYDMSIVERRITEKGPLLDDFPKLKFKAYLSAARDDEALASAENLYAPFYVWDEPAGLSNFLCGPGFAAVTQAFGWPQVKTWVVWQAALSSALGEAAFATREIVPLEPYADLARLREEGIATAGADIANGILASVAGFEPTGWTRVHFRLWRSAPPRSEAGQIYRVGHLSRPGLR